MEYTEARFDWDWSKSHEGVKRHLLNLYVLKKEKAHILKSTDQWLLRYALKTNIWGRFDPPPPGIGLISPYIGFPRRTERIAPAATVSAGLSPVSLRPLYTTDIQLAELSTNFKPNSASKVKGNLYLNIVSSCTLWRRRQRCNYLCRVNSSHICDIGSLDLEIS